MTHQPARSRARLGASAPINAALAATSVLGLLALATVQAQAGPVAQPQGSEKCYGVAKAGRNDCAAGVHSCAATSNKSFDKASFVYLPKGACSKLAGGSLAPSR
jgi:uncharacterized membrane protein